MRIRNKIRNNGVEIKTYVNTMVGCWALYISYTGYVIYASKVIN
jgi:hypothetical protein